MQINNAAQIPGDNHRARPGNAVTAGFGPGQGQGDAGGHRRRQRHRIGGDGRQIGVGRQRPDNCHRAATVDGQAIGLSGSQLQRGTGRNVGRQDQWRGNAMQIHSAAQGSGNGDRARTGDGVTTSLGPVQGQGDTGRHRSRQRHRRGGDGRQIGIGSQCPDDGYGTGAKKTQAISLGPTQGQGDVGGDIGRHCRQIGSDR